MTPVPFAGNSSIQLRGRRLVLWADPGSTLRTRWLPVYPPNSISGLYCLWLSAAAALALNTFLPEVSCLSRRIKSMRSVTRFYFFQECLEDARAGMLFSKVGVSVYEVFQTDCRASSPFPSKHNSSLLCFSYSEGRHSAGSQCWTGSGLVFCQEMLLQLKVNSERGAMGKNLVLCLIYYRKCQMLDILSNMYYNFI